jgi:hypothetical protein
VYDRLVVVYTCNNRSLAASFHSLQTRGCSGALDGAPGRVGHPPRFAAGLSFQMMPRDLRPRVSAISAERLHMRRDGGQPIGAHDDEVAQG